MENTYQISVNRHYNPKKDKEYNNNKVSKGWSLESYSWTEESVRTLTTQHGISCNEYFTDHRTTDNWKAATHIMLDFDDGSVKAEDLLTEQASWEHDSYIYSSQNHQKMKNGLACDRLRALIPLAEPVTCNEDLKALEQYFLAKYPNLDKSFMGRSRYFAHGTTDVSSFKNSKGPFKWTEIPKLSQYKLKPQSWKKKTEKMIHCSDRVLDANKETHLIGDILPDIPIYCPFCGQSAERSNPGHNAVIKLNDNDLPFLFCSSCKSRDFGNQGVYNFDPVDGFIYRSALEEKLLFIDIVKARYMGGCIENGSDDFVIRDLGGKENVPQFCKYHSIPIPEIFPRARYDLIFDSNKRADFDAGYVNKYTVTEYLKKPVPNNYTAQLPGYIGKLVDHVMAHDKDIIDRFYNDMAWFVQNRKKLITTYLMQGVEGTGKGTLFSQVFQPIFGKRFCVQTDQDAFGSQFNSFLTDNVLVLVNEVSGNFSSNDGKNLKTIEKMKIAITDENIQIEGKNKDRVNGNNICSFLFATNRRDAITLSDNDRRFNVAPRQETKLQDTSWWPGYTELIHKLRSELQEFVWYLKQYAVEESLIGRIIDNEPKRVLQIMSRTNSDVFFEAVKNGDINWLWENRFVDQGSYNADEKNARIEKILVGLSGADKVSVSDLCTLYNNINRKNLSNVAFGKIASAHLGTSKSIRLDDKTYQGFDIKWQEKDQDGSLFS